MICTLIAYIRSVSDWLIGETAGTIAPDDQLWVSDTLLPVYALVPCLIVGVLIGVVITFVHQSRRTSCVQASDDFDCKMTDAQVFECISVRF